MKSTEWKDIAELLGIGAIVASLIFVGFQMKQTQDIALAQTYQARADASANASFAIMQSPEALSGWSMLQKGEQLDFNSPESIALCRWLVGVFFVFENSYFQHQMGFLPQDHWSRVRSTIKATLKGSRQFRPGCNVEMNLREEFRQEMDRIAQEIEEESAKPE